VNDIDLFGTVGIVGCGTMGAGLAEVCAAAGLDVRVAVSRPRSVEDGRDRITASLNRAPRGGKVDLVRIAEVLSRIHLTTNLTDLADCRLVFESVVEDLAVKTKLFAALGRLLEDPAAILATNTSSIPIARLGEASGRGGHVVGTHFFNPVPAMPLVELTASALTRPETVDRVEAFVTGPLGKQAIRSPDRVGFVVNALLVPFLMTAMRMVEAGHASADTVDKGMTLGCGHPMGPLRLADLIGLDTLADVAALLHEESGDPVFTPPPLLLELVELGRLGRKSGHGFFEYTAGRTPQ
jgi:3-hydroxybutyryl-CoA dehydrogenase